jgi:hypothetical protein
VVSFALVIDVVPGFRSYPTLLRCAKLYLWDCVAVRGATWNAAMLILDGNLGGWLDQVEGVLHVEEGSSSAAADARKFNGLSDWAGKLGAIRKNVGAKVLAMTD